jgi:hypothetical protein
MRDIRAEAGDNLDALALLYANGEMDAAQAAAFERRLGEDQGAREALSVAVELARTLDGLPTPMPDPAYRAAVRRRLPPAGVWGRLTARRHRGHPVMWAALGAAAVFLAVVVANGFRAPPPSQSDQAQAAPTQAVEPVQPPAEDTALFWAELPKHERMNRLREEDQQRKARPEDMRLARNEDSANRVMAEPPMPRP